MVLEDGPFLFGRPEDYARGKATGFPNEGGPVVLAVDIPESIVLATVSDWFPLSQGLVQFDHEAGLAILLEAWPSLAKKIWIVS